MKISLDNVANLKDDAAISGDETLSFNELVKKMERYCSFRDEEDNPDKLIYILTTE